MKAVQLEYRVKEEMSGRNAGQIGWGSPAGHGAGLSRNSKCTGSQCRLEGRARERSDMFCRITLAALVRSDSGVWGRSGSSTRGTGDCTRASPHTPAPPTCPTRNTVDALISCLDFSSNPRAEFPSSGPRTSFQSNALPGSSSESISYILSPSSFEIL